MFSLLTILSIIIIIYCIILLIIDIINHRKGTIGLSIKSQEIIIKHNANLPDTIISKIYELITKISKWYHIQFGLDTGLWVIVKICFEIIEILLQSQALLLYNGVYIFDRNDVYLAYDSGYIIAFATVLCLNCLLCGILWLLYAFKPKICHGFSFDSAIFIVDIIFDLFYTIFPLIVVLSVDEDSDIFVSLASLQIENTLSLSLDVFYEHKITFGCSVDCRFWQRLFHWYFSH